MTARPVASGPAVAAAPRVRAAAPAGEAFGGIAWSPDYLALLYYMASIITFRLPGAAVAAAVCLALLALRIDTLQLPRPLIWFLGFIAWSGVTVFTSPFRALAFDQFVILVKLFLVAFMAANVIRSKAQLRFTLGFAVVCFIIFPFRGAITNYFFGYALFGRAIWNFVYANPNDMAAFAIIYASFALAASSLYRTKWIRLSLLAAALGFGALILLSQSRGAIVGVGLAGLLMFVHSRQRVRIMVGALAIAVVGAIVAPKSLWQRLSGLAKISAASGMAGVDQERSAEQRFQIAKVAVTIAKDNPVLGVGIGAYPEAHAVYATRLIGELPLAGGKRDAHNTWLRLAAETGMVGLLLFLGLLGSVGRTIRRVLKQPNAAPEAQDGLRWLGLGLIAFFLAGTFGSFAYLNVLYLDFVLIWTLSRQSAAGQVARSAPMRAVTGSRAMTRGFRGGMGRAPVLRPHRPSAS